MTGTVEDLTPARTSHQAPTEAEKAGIQAGTVLDRFAGWRPEIWNGFN